MTLERVATAHYRRQVNLARRAALRVGRLWRSVDPGDIRASWSARLAEVLAVVSSAQAIAATSSPGYVDDVLAVQGFEAAPEGRVSASRFAGVASDGRDLAGLLVQPVVRTLAVIGAGATPRRALVAGAVELDMIVRTQVADAGRAADGVAIAARPGVRGYTRVLVGKSCARCVVLAGRWYGWNAGFERHPRCDCRHVPTVRDASDDVRTGPRAYFDSLTPVEQDQLVGKAGAEAVRDGAEIAQVVNARRGLRAAGATTTEGTTRRGLAGQRLGRGRVRLMPEAIYRAAAGDRDEAIRLLRLNGYLL